MVPLASALLIAALAQPQEIVVTGRGLDATPRTLWLGLSWRG